MLKELITKKPVVKGKQLSMSDKVVSLERGKQRKMAGIEPSGLGFARQTFGESLPVVAEGPEGPFVGEQAVEVEALDGQVLDVSRELVDQKVAVLSQDGDGVFVGLFSDHLKRV